MVIRCRNIPFWASQVSRQAWDRQLKLAALYGLDCGRNKKLSLLASGGRESFAARALSRGISQQHQSPTGPQLTTDRSRYKSTHRARPV